MLHTWNQKLEHHPHVHCVVPEGGIAPDGSRWVRPRRPLFLPVKAMAKAFRGKFGQALEQAFAASCPDCGGPMLLIERLTPA